MRCSAAARLGLLVLLLPLPLPAGAEVHSAIHKLTAPGEVVYVVDEQGGVLVNIDAERRFIPASILKVLTCLLAAEHLGLDSRFTTAFFGDGDRLVVQSQGDPFLVSEELDLIAAALRPRIASGRLSGVVIDNSFFVRDIVIPGVGRSGQPYDAPNSATSVNFNTIAVTHRNGKIVSAEPQTPLTPLAESLARRHKVRGPARISIGNRNGEAARYAGEVIAAKLRDAGIKVDGRIGEGSAPAAEPLYVHHNTRTLADVCRELLQHSNNYIANQVFLTIGAKVEGPPASLAKSVTVADRFLALHPELRDITVTEGSGISYDNRVTATAMAALLQHFVPYRGLLRDKDGVPHKTGTLAVTRTLVGYLDTEHHGTVRFVIALDGTKQDRRWQIVDALRRSL
jgi:D-alanyl-D-alanine carboxypeptidase/D-alanyl-D-alanine-endopeptidase (penicillin-binding protein 4)